MIFLFQGGDVRWLWQVLCDVDADADLLQLSSTDVGVCLYLPDVEWEVANCAPFCMTDVGVIQTLYNRLTTQQLSVSRRGLTTQPWAGEGLLLATGLEVWLPIWSLWGLFAIA